MPRKKKGADGYYRMSFTYNGKQYSVRSKDPKQLSAKISEKIQVLSAGQKIIHETMTVKAWGAEWHKTYNTRLQAGAQSRIKSTLKKYVYPEIGYMKIKNVQPMHCQRILNNMEGMSKDTVKKARSLLFNLFETAKENSLCVSNPAQKLTLPRTAAQGTHRSITPRERIILLETAKAHPAGPWALLLLYTGIRPGESIVLTGADILNGKININKTYDRASCGAKEPKSKSGYRCIPIIEPLSAVLPTVTDENINEPLFKNSLGRSLNEKSMARMWKSFRAAMAQTEQRLTDEGRIDRLSEVLPDMVPYDLRHTFCTDLERAGVPLNIASKLMGHASIEITAKIYTHTGEEMLDKAADQLETLLSQTGDIVGDITNITKQHPITPNEGKTAQL